MALGSTHALAEMISRNISRGKRAASALGSQPYYFYVLIVSKSESLKLLEPSGTVICLHRDFSKFTFSCVFKERPLTLSQFREL
jgi:hypothetical protein